ncbi:uncharacterized protein LOC129753477 [Uranotaenia lowii]|uniref:uncharacterized protein LOC129753477 n=1 Tax=Uranotaenia lowii TaxID=190385 RepID=UPI00247AABF6|nr:uncharacterized protein LOC129753477 [Uranotaenia lowii]
MSRDQDDGDGLNPGGLHQSISSANQKCTSLCNIAVLPCVKISHDNGYDDDTMALAERAALLHSAVINLLIISSSWSIQLVQARRCYVCGEGSEAPFRTAAMAASNSHHQNGDATTPFISPKLPTVASSCDDFERDRTELDKYVLECPPSYTSCLTQVDGDVELRMCGEPLAINDCKSANMVDYCYCNEDLCNSLTRVQIRRRIEDAHMGVHSQHLRQNHEHNNSDDEDLTESSGMEDTLAHHEKHGRPGGDRSLHHERNYQDTTQIMVTLRSTPSHDRRNGSGSESASGSKSWIDSSSGVLAIVCGVSLWRFMRLRYQPEVV